MEKLYKINLYDSDNHDVVVIHLEPGILEFESSGPLGSLQTNQLEVMEFQLSYFKT